MISYDIHNFFVVGGGLLIFLWIIRLAYAFRSLTNFSEASDNRRIIRANGLFRGFRNMRVFGGPEEFIRVLSCNNEKNSMEMNKVKQLRIETFCPPHKVILEVDDQERRGEFNLRMAVQLEDELKEENMEGIEEILGVNVLIGFSRVKWAHLSSRINSVKIEKEPSKERITIIRKPSLGLLSTGSSVNVALDSKLLSESTKSVFSQKSFRSVVQRTRSLSHNELWSELLECAQKVYGSDSMKVAKKRMVNLQFTVSLEDLFKTGGSQSFPIGIIVQKKNCPNSSVEFLLFRPNSPMPYENGKLSEIKHWIETMELTQHCVITSSGVFNIEEIYGLDQIRPDFTGPDANSRRSSFQDQPLDSQDCVICLSETKNVILIPCRHCCICDECLLQIDKCPICRSHFGSHLRPERGTESALFVENNNATGPKLSVIENTDMAIMEHAHVET